MGVASTSTPHRPNTTEGTTDSRSITYTTGVFSHEGRDLGHEQGDADAQRDGEDDRDDRGDERAEEERQHPELALARRPPSGEQEASGVVPEDRPRLLARRPRDEREDDEHGKARGQCDDREDAIAHWPLAAKARVPTPTVVWRRRSWASRCVTSWRSDSCCHSRRLPASADLNLVELGDRLLQDVVGQRCVVKAGQHVLAFPQHVGDERLVELTLLGVRLVGVDDDVCLERDRIGGRSARVVCVEREIRSDLDTLARRRCSLGCRLDEVARLVLHGRELKPRGRRIRQVHVPDCAVGRLDDLGHALVAVARLGVGWPLDRRARLERPHVRRRDNEPLGEVLRRTRPVRPVSHRDVGGGEIDTFVVGRDLRVVPRRDLPLEDASDRVRAELQVIDSRQVVRDRHRAEQDREVEDRFRRLVLVLVRGVRPGKVDGLLGEVRPPLARAASAVGDVRVRVRIVEHAGGFLDERQREAGSASLKGA